MDPNENIRRQRELVREIQALEDHPDRNTTGAPGDFGPAEEYDAKLANLAVELAELVQALDAWLCKGGFRPSGWDALARSQARMGGVRGD